MFDACHHLFLYTMSHVTPADIAAYAPADPGYPNYVRAYTEILEVRKLPKEADFDITETIGLTRWSDAKTNREPVRFRRFRTFTNAVGMALSAADRDRRILPPNYTAIILIEDAIALNDPQLQSLLIPAFQEFHDALDQMQHEESPFLLLALLLLCFLERQSSLNPDQLARQLIAEESRVKHWEGYDFLWGCTNMDQLFHCWKYRVRQLLLPETPHLKLVHDALLGGGNW